MRKSDLVELCEEGMSQRAIAAHYGVTQATVRYHLRKHGLKTRRGPHGKVPKDLVTPRQCACGETDPKKFYGSKTSICAHCHNEYTKAKGRETKTRAVAQLGGKCEACGFKRYPSSLALHHPDPSKKDPSFKSMRYWSWARVLREIEKCVVLCMNCHTAVHAGELSLNPQALA